MIERIEGRRGMMNDDENNKRSHVHCIKDNHPRSRFNLGLGHRHLVEHLGSVSMGAIGH